LISYLNAGVKFEFFGQISSEEFHCLRNGLKAGPYGSKQKQKTPEIFGFFFDPIKYGPEDKK
jgi:hypothetical protein